MRLWHLERLEGYRDGRTLAAVVRAATEREAREAARDDEAERAGRGGGTPDAWLDPAQVSCVELSPEGESGVVVVDFYEP